jgi:hypothetical protein
MKLLVKFASILAVCLIALTAYGQQTRSRSAAAQSSFAGSLASGTGRAAVVVVRSAAKMSWETTKFTAKHVAAPTAKTVVLKIAPKAAVFTIKKTGITAKYLLPLAVKLSLF